MIDRVDNSLIRNVARQMILEGETPEVLICELCDHFCYGSKKCKLGKDPDCIDCETNTHWDFSGEE